jgi:hypothetical protein
LAVRLGLLPVRRPGVSSSSFPSKRSRAVRCRAVERRSLGPLPRSEAHQLLFLRSLPSTGSAAPCARHRLLTWRGIAAISGQCPEQPACGSANFPGWRHVVAKAGALLPEHRDRVRVVAFGDRARSMCGLFYAVRPDGRSVPPRSSRRRPPQQLQSTRLKGQPINAACCARRNMRKACTVSLLHHMKNATLPRGTRMDCGTNVSASSSRPHSAPWPRRSSGKGPEVLLPSPLRSR